MKTLIIYDSNYGNTQKIAELLAQELEGEALNVKNIKDSNLENIDLLILGSPINGWRPSEKTIQFLSSREENQLAGIKATSYDTRVRLFIHGDAVKKMLVGLRQAGADTSLPSEVFYVKGTKGPLLEGETDKARTWCKTILTKLKQ